MSRALTKAQLAAELAASHEAYQRLLAERDALKAQLNERAVPAPRTSGLDRRAAMAAARDEAMRTGRCVRAF